MDAAVVSRWRRAAAQALDDRRWLALCVLAAIALRLPFLGEPLGNDEGGYAYVARAWDDGAGGLYGEQWVDRPPLLFALYRVALALGGELGVRLLGCVAAGVTVAASGAAAGQVGGSRALRWAALCAAALTSSLFIQSHMVNAELLALPFVALSAWLVVLAMQAVRPRRAVLLGAAAGGAATCALAVKQSFADGLVFCFVAVVAYGALERRRDGRVPASAWGALAGGLAGIGVVAASVVAWAELVGPGTSALLDALYGFRLEAREVIAASRAPDERARLVALIAAASGMLSLLVVVWIGLLRIIAARRPVVGDAPLVRAVAIATLALGCWSFFAVTQGGNWWRHYLLQLVPALAIGTGLVIGAVGDATRSAVARSARWWGWAVAGVTLAGWVAGVVWVGARGDGHAQHATGDWLRSASTEGDTLLVTWGNPNVLQRSGLRTPYSLSWSLPVRVRDPRLDELRKLLAGSDAPTWIVQWHSLGLWNLDDDRDIRQLVRERYQVVAEVCGKRIYRRRDAYPPSEPVPPPPPREACGEGRPGILGLPVL